MITALLIILGFVLVLRFLRRRKRFSNEPPLSTGWIPWIGYGIAYRRDAFSLLDGIRKSHGNVFTLYMGGKFYTFVTDARMVRALMKDDKKLDFREMTFSAIKRVFDLDRPPAHIPQLREVFMPYLQGSGLNNLTEKISQNIQNETENYRTSSWQETSLFSFTQDIVFSAGFKTFFSIHTKDPPDLTQIKKDFEYLDVRFPSLAVGSPLQSAKKAAEVRSRILEALRRQTEKKEVMEMFEKRNDILRKIGKFCRIPKEELSMLWASQSNTTAMCFWVLYFILKHEEAFEAVMNEMCDVMEIDNLEQETDKIELFTKKNLEKMPMLESIIKESLRLRVSSLSARYIKEDCYVEDPDKNNTYRLRAGDCLMIPFSLIHLDPEIYTDPHTFRYDRFFNCGSNGSTPFTKRGKKISTNLQPFGIGTSICPGRFLALNELKIVVVLLIKNFKMKLLNPEEEILTSNDRFGFGVLFPEKYPLVRFKWRR